MDTPDDVPPSLDIVISYHCTCDAEQTYSPDAYTEYVEDFILGHIIQMPPIG